MLQVVLTFLSSEGRTVMDTPCDNVSQTFLGGSNALTNQFVAQAFGGYATLYGNMTDSTSPGAAPAGQGGGNAYILPMMIAIVIMVAHTTTHSCIQTCWMHQARQKGAPLIVAGANQGGSDDRQLVRQL